MTLKEWIFSSYPNPSINGQWGTLHIVTLILCVGLIVAIALIFRKKDVKVRTRVLWVLVGLIVLFEVARRIINFSRGNELTLNSFLGTLLPRPWCAIACWTLIASVFVKKDWFYSFASITALLCALIFFAYPSVGFNNQYILFENLYSIATHSLLLITSITLITLRLAKFNYKDFWKVAIAYAVVYAYAFMEIYLLKIEADPLYFMPGNDVQEIIGLSHGIYVVVYIAFIALYTNIFYLIEKWNSKRTINKQNLPLSENVKNNT